MTREEAIAMFVNSITPHVQSGQVTKYLSSMQLASLLIEAVGDKRTAEFVAALGGECLCPNEWCMAKVVDAVNKCMAALQATGEQNAPTSSTVH